MSDDWRGVWFLLPVKNSAMLLESWNSGSVLSLHVATVKKQQKTKNAAKVIEYFMESHKRLKFVLVCVVFVLNLSKRN